MNGLYTAELLVAEQSVQVDPKLVKTALGQVLVKVSGQQSLLDQPELDAGLKQANRYIQQFRYQNTQVSMETDDGRQVLAHRLVIDFEKTLVNELLASAGVRPLGTVRPGVLVWLMEERRGKRRFLGLDEDPAFVAMNQRARERGLPIFRPLLDMTDQKALPIGDAWGFFTDSIIKASQRYQADSVLVGRLYRDAEGQWRSRWMLLKSSGELQNFANSGRGFSGNLSGAVDKTADLLFADFVAPAGELDPGSLLLEIEAVSSMQSYFQIQQYLGELPAVKNSALHSLVDDRLLLKLEIDGSVNQISGALGLNSAFKVVPSYETDGRLSYRWQP
ncbi:MAG: DUF2066 domain-containing protein [Motiliproteus sp.]